MRYIKSIRSYKIWLLLLLAIGLCEILYIQISPINKRAQNNKDHASIYGDYIAGYYANKVQDVQTSARLFQDVIDKGVSDPAIIEYAYISHVLAGNVEKAIAVVKKSDPEHISGLGALLLVIGEIKQDDYKSALNLLQNSKALSNDSFMQSLASLLKSWCFIASKNIKDATVFDGTMSDLDARVKYGLVLPQQGIIAAFANDFDLAGKKFSEIENSDSEAYLYYNLVLMADFYSKLGEKGKAHDIYLKLKEVKFLVSAADLYIDQLKRDKRKTEINNPKQGIAWLLTNSSSILDGSYYGQISIFFAQLALYIDPDSEQANLFMAEYYSSASNALKAIIHLNRINEKSFYYVKARINKALALYSLEQKQEALDALSSIPKKPFNIDVELTIADIKSKEEDYKSAISHYSKIIKNYSSQDSNAWLNIAYLHYFRGYNYAMLKDYENSEKDYLQALQHDKSLYLAMNDLGYQWIEQGKNIEEAISMIKAALEQDPESPAILDSMGWGYFMQKKYVEALPYLEKAINMAAGDAAINDHLGDVYWHLDMKEQARLQWKRALELYKETVDQHKTQLKLENGI